MIRPTGSASGGPEEPRYGQLAAWAVVPSLTSPLFYYFLPSCRSLSLWSAFERFGSWRCDWIYTLKRLAAERRGLLVKEANGNALAGAVIKRKERPRVRAHRFGLGQLLRARVRPMAGDLPSGYSLAGQSGLV